MNVMWVGRRKESSYEGVCITNGGGGECVCNVCVRVGGWVGGSLVVEV